MNGHVKKIVMKNESTSQCTNCSELWSRIDKLTDEKEKIAKKNTYFAILIGIWATLSLVELCITLIK